METLSYEKRIELGNLVPALGQFKVMEKIPQYQQCEVHNLVEAPAEVPETLRHVVFNIERGQTLHETIDFLNMCPDLKNMDIIYANELDDGAVRSGNCNVAYEIAKSIGMNYAYGLEFIELVNPEIVSVSDETQTGLEGCLSLPGKWGIVTRPLRATVRAQDRYGDWYEYEGEELLARAFLHEIDHLDGHLYPEIAEKMLTAEELEEMLKQEKDAIEAEGEDK